jgi:hypothetical protein
MVTTNTHLGEGLFTFPQLTQEIIRRQENVDALQVEIREIQARILTGENIKSNYFLDLQYYEGSGWFYTESYRSLIDSEVKIEENENKIFMDVCSKEYDVEVHGWHEKLHIGNVENGVRIPLLKDLTRQLSELGFNEHVVQEVRRYFNLSTRDLIQLPLFPIWD